MCGPAAVMAVAVGVGTGVVMEMGEGGCGWQHG